MSYASPKWHYPRPELAQTLLDHMEDTGGKPISLFSGRRKGKTTLLLHDLQPAAIEQGYFPVYVDFWELKGDATAALNNGLAEAMQSLQRPSNAIQRILQTPIRRLAVGGLGSIDFGDVPELKRPENEQLQIRWHLTEIVRLSKKPVLLMLDEFQQIASDVRAEQVSATLRAALTRLSGRVCPVFAGSSESKLSQMFHQQRAPLYNFATHHPLPNLDTKFVNFVCERFSETSDLEVDSREMWSVFRELDYQPGTLLDLVTYLIRERSTDVRAAMRAHLAEVRALREADYQAAFDRMSELDRLVLVDVAEHRQLTSRQALARYADELGVDRVYPNSVTRAIKRLHDLEYVSRDMAGGYRVTHDSLWRWVKRQSELAAPPPAQGQGALDWGDMH